jgi:hypothetical protein
MSDRQDEQLPERLRAAGATKLEQRLLDAAARERPTRTASERMARAIGVAAPAVPGTASTPNAHETVPPPAAVASGSAVPWVSGVVIALAVGGAWVVSRSDAPRSAPASFAAPVAVASAPGPAASGPGATPATTSPPEAPATAAPRPRPSAGPGAGDLREQIALLDAARSAMNAGKHARALSTLERYLTSYPAGSFRPEATALKIESLAKLGRSTESRAMADRFVAEHQGSPLAKRVKEVTQPSPR